MRCSSTLCDDHHAKAHSLELKFPYSKSISSSTKHDVIGFKSSPILFSPDPLSDQSSFGRNSSLSMMSLEHGSQMSSLPVSFSVFQLLESGLEIFSMFLPSSDPEGEGITGTTSIGLFEELMASFWVL